MNWLEKLLKEANMKPAKLAEITGIDEGVISKIRRDKIKGYPAYETLLAISKALDVPIDAIYRAVGLLPPITPQEEWVEKIKHRLPNVQSEVGRKVVEGTINNVAEKQKRVTSHEKT